jgi:competence protein ComGC
MKVCSKKKEKTAFGLVELIIVIMWIGILAVITVPRLNRAAILKHKAGKNARKIVADLRIVQMKI